jgi:hypothetical protein
MFEETLPTGTASLCDEGAWRIHLCDRRHAVTVGGPATCALMPREVPYIWKNTGSQTEPGIKDRRRRPAHPAATCDGFLDYAKKRSNRDA